MSTHCMTSFIANKAAAILASVFIPFDENSDGGKVVKAAVSVRQGEEARRCLSYVCEKIRELVWKHLCQRLARGEGQG